MDLPEDAAEMLFAQIYLVVLVVNVNLDTQGMLSSNA
jgi:hypothetical protein